MNRESRRLVVFVVRIVMVTVSEVVVAIGVAVSVVSSCILGRNLVVRSKSVVRLEVVLVRVQRIRVRGGCSGRVHLVREFLLKEEEGDLNFGFIR